MNKEILVDSLEDVIRSRKSIRTYSKEFPNEEVVKKIVQSAIYAPYSRATGLPYQEIRRIFILSQNTEKIEIARELLLSEMRKISVKVNRLLFFFPFLRKRMGPFANKIAIQSKTGIPSLNDAAYYVIIAEKKGFPLMAKQSIAYAMENIWLSTTDAGLGFQLITETGILSDNKQFCDLLGLPKGYQLDGCVIGIPKSTTAAELKQFDFDKFVTWL
ncbi:MAG TPA: nitroreductase family protein [Paludibacter sp.]|nr:nitroreductase family protein [Paludibacter sp.]